MTISNWPKAEQPREKLRTRGTAALSDAELLAIFLRTGTNGKTAIDITRELLSDFEGLRPLIDTDEKQFCNKKGLGPAKYVQIQAAIELGRRYLEAGLIKSNVLSCPRIPVIICGQSYVPILMRCLPACFWITATG